jgi:hypothetical protein
MEEFVRQPTFMLKALAAARSSLFRRNGPSDLGSQLEELLVEVWRQEALPGEAAAEWFSGGEAELSGIPFSFPQMTNVNWIPQGKFGYLLNNSSKAGIFRDSMGFDQESLGTALGSILSTTSTEFQPLCMCTRLGRSTEAAPARLSPLGTFLGGVIAGARRVARLVRRGTNLRS